MSKPHVCPKCSGEGKIPNDTGTSACERVCPCCHGACVLWEPASLEIGATRLPGNYAPRPLLQAPVRLS